MSDRAPRSQTLQARIGAQAATGDGSYAVAEAPFDGTVTAVRYVPDGSVTGANTNTRTIALVNETASKTVATLALTSGTNLTAETAASVPVSGTASNVAVSAGDVLAVTSTHSGSSGLADPGGLIQVDISSS